MQPGQPTVTSLEPWILDSLKPILYSNRAEPMRHEAARSVLRGFRRAPSRRQNTPRDRTHAGKEQAVTPGGVWENRTHPAHPLVTADEDSVAPHRSREG